MAHQIIQDKLLTLRSVALFPSAKPTCHIMQSTHRFQGSRHGPLAAGGAHSTTMTERFIILSRKHPHEITEKTGGEWEPGHMAQGRGLHTLSHMLQKRKEKLCLKTWCLRVFQTRKGISVLLGAPKKEERRRPMMGTV